MMMTETNQIIAVANDDPEKEFETRRQRHIDAQAKTLAHRLERDRFKKALGALLYPTPHKNKSND